MLTKRAPSKSIIEIEPAITKILRTRIKMPKLWKLAKKHSIRGNQSKVNLIRALLKKGYTFQKGTHP